MHTYKDAILETKGAYVLYPGNKCEIFRVDENETIPSVGAFPLTPGEKGLEEDNPNSIFKSCFKKYYWKRFKMKTLCIVPCGKKEKVWNKIPNIRPQ